MNYTHLALNGLHTFTLHVHSTLVVLHCMMHACAYHFSCVAHCMQACTYHFSCVAHCMHVAVYIPLELCWGKIVW